MLTCCKAELARARIIEVIDDKPGLEQVSSHQKKLQEKLKFREKIKKNFCL